jgi:biotin carboxylase
MPRVFAVYPTEWDAKQLGRLGRDVELGTSDPDALQYIARETATRRGQLAGVFSTSDYPGAATAGAIATTLGLPGTPPDRILRASHKWYSRLEQARVAPEAVPRFALVGADDFDADPPLAYPCFIKPVKGQFSILARRLESRAELRAFLRRPAVRDFCAAYVTTFNRMLAAYAPECAVDGRHFIVEELLAGRQVTVEGFARGGVPEVFGVVDSVLHPRTGSFVRFEYPSALPARVQERMADVARRVVAGLGLRDGCFNLEMFWDEAADRVSVIEVNPRLCGQFADLYAKVDGFHTYDLAIALCTGAEPRVSRRAGRYRFAASVPLRIYEPSRVVRVPSAGDIAAAEALFPETQVWCECTAGEALVDFERSEDGASTRYGVINLGANTREALVERAAAVEERLGFEFERASREN